MYKIAATKGVTDKQGLDLVKRRNMLTCPRARGVGCENFLEYAYYFGLLSMGCTLIFRNPFTFYNLNLFISFFISMWKLLTKSFQKWTRRLGGSFGSPGPPHLGSTWRNSKSRNIQMIDMLRMVKQHRHKTWRLSLIKTKIKESQCFEPYSLQDLWPNDLFKKIC